MNDDEMNPFWVEDDEGVFRVVDGVGQTFLQIRDRATAEHYVDLLNKAHRTGYKSGYRAGKKKSLGSA